MAVRLGRKAAFAALWTALRGARGGPPLGQRLGAVPRLLWNTVTMRYDGKGRLFAMLLAMAYIASPIDFLPEAFLGPFGLPDDAFVVVWLAGAVLSETERYLGWERRRATVIDGHPAGR